VIRLIRQGYGDFSPRHAIGPAGWPHHDLLFVHAGRIELERTGDGARLRLGRGEGVLIHPRTPFRGRTLTPAARASIQHFEVGAGTSAPWAGLRGQHGGWTPSAGGPSPALQADVERALSAARRAAADASRTDAWIFRLGTVLAEGGFFSAAPATHAGRFGLAELEAWLRARLRENPGVDALAAHCGLSPGRFRTVFRAEHGVTAGAFLRSVRDAEARRRLSETNEPAKVIAAALGYADPVAFHRAFAGRQGLTPGAYRRRHRLSG